MAEATAKKQKRYDFTKGDILKPMILFSLPILFGDIFNAMYNVVDSLVVGQFVGSNALAAVNSSFAITMVTVAIYAGFGMGSGVVIGQLFGAKRMDDLGKAVSTALLGAVLIGGSMIILGQIISAPLLRVINTPQEIMADATVYLRIYMLGCMTQLMYFMSSGIMRALGDSKHPMYYLIVCAILNIVLDILFVAVFHWDCAGVAAATVISQAVSAVLSVRRILTGYGIKIVKKDFKIYGSIMKMILKIGIPAAVQQMVNSVGMLFIQSYSNSFGTALVAANGVHQKLDSFAQLPIMALGQTITTFNSQNLGAGEKERAKTGNRQITVVLFVMCMVIGTVLFFACEPLYRLFINKNDANLDLAVHIGVTAIRINAFFYWAIGLQMAYMSILRGIGAAIPTMIIVISCTIARVPLTYFLARIFAIPRGADAATAMQMGSWQNLYWANNIYFIAVFLLMLLYYKFGKWEKYVVVRRSGRGPAPAANAQESKPEEAK